MPQLQIIYCNPYNRNDEFELQFQIRHISIAKRWVERLLSAKQKYTIDDPGRFYGFGSVAAQTEQALVDINQCIDDINSFESIIDRHLRDINDQDTLNYLHHIFETYHGLLDQQQHDFWRRAPDLVRKNLANLNVLVHRCESIYRGARPRHVVTWYGLPKTEKLSDIDYSQFQLEDCFGSVCLNYVEIGKTLEDLAYDNDQYISDQAFRPFKHFSADFNVKFFEDSNRLTREKYNIIKNYYNSNRSFFADRGYAWEDPKLAIGSIVLADLSSELSREEILAALETRQWVKFVNIF